MELLVWQRFEQSPVRNVLYHSSNWSTIIRDMMLTFSQLSRNGEQYDTCTITVSCVPMNLAELLSCEYDVTIIRPISY